MKLESLDLNLLLVFEALFVEGSVTRAAARVGLSQPATSNALGRLRARLADPLFVLERGRMVPTPRARALSRPVQEALLTLRSALGAQPAFDPAISDRRFDLATNDYLEATLLPRVLDAVAHRTLRVEIASRRVRYLFEPPQEALANGELDLALGFFPATPGQQTGLLGEPLRDERFVCLARRGNPRLADKLTLKRFLACGHLRVVFAGAPRAGLVDATLASRGLARRVVGTVAHLLSLPAIVAGSNLLAVVPVGLIGYLPRQPGVFVHELPFAMPPFTTSMVWHERSNSDPALAWLRGLLRELARPSAAKQRRGRPSA